MWFVSEQNISLICACQQKRCKFNAKLKPAYCFDFLCESFIFYFRTVFHFRNALNSTKEKQTNEKRKHLNEMCIVESNRMYCCIIVTKYL